MPLPVCTITFSMTSCRRVYYKLTDSPLWKVIQAAADVIEPD
jgi:hypothetical protein